jgi:cytochrome c biogenesis protein CcdA
MLTLAAGFSAGLAASVSPCVAAVLPAVAVRLSRTGSTAGTGANAGRHGSVGAAAPSLLLFAAGFHTAYLALSAVLAGALAAPLQAGLRLAAGAAFAVAGALLGAGRLDGMGSRCVGNSLFFFCFFFLFRRHHSQIFLQPTAPTPASGMCEEGDDERGHLRDDADLHHGGKRSRSVVSRIRAVAGELLQGALVACAVSINPCTVPFLAATVSAVAAASNLASDTAAVELTPTLWAWLAPRLAAAPALLAFSQGLLTPALVAVGAARCGSSLADRILALGGSAAEHDGSSSCHPSHPSHHHGFRPRRQAAHGWLWTIALGLRATVALLWQIAQPASLIASGLYLSLKVGFLSAAERHVAALVAIVTWVPLVLARAIPSYGTAARRTRVVAVVVIAAALLTFVLVCDSAAHSEEGHAEMSELMSVSESAGAAGEEQEESDEAVCRDPSLIEPCGACDRCVYWFLAIAGSWTSALLLMDRAWLRPGWPFGSSLDENQELPIWSSARKVHLV